MGKEKLPYMSFFILSNLSFIILLQKWLNKNYMYMIMHVFINICYEIPRQLRPYNSRVRGYESCPPLLIIIILGSFQYFIFALLHFIFLLLLFEKLCDNINIPMYALKYSLSKYTIQILFIILIIKKLFEIFLINNSPHLGFSYLIFF